MSASPTSYRGRIITRFGAEMIVEDEQFVQHRCNARRKLDDAVCGDYVTCSTTLSGNDVITSINPRNTLLERIDARGRKRSIAANINLVVIVTACRPAPNNSLIDRMLVASHRLGTETLLLLNKCDLIDSLQQARGTMQRYLDSGYSMLETSATGQQGIKSLVAALRDRTCIFVGQSGVGKSALLDTLLPGIDLQVGELSEKSGEGMHTTSRATLYHLPNGGHVIDSPGVRAFDLKPMKAGELASCFPDFSAHLDGCRFHNCLHHDEPDCAIQQAVASSKISTVRYQSYLNILAQIRAHTE